MVPVELDREGQVLEPNNTTHPFMRGIMTFDDYNYEQFNQYILISEPHESEKKRIINDRKVIGDVGSIGKSSSENKFFSVDNLENKIEEKKYQHEALTLEPSEYELE